MIRFLFFAQMMFAAGVYAAGTPTNVTVRVVSRDAKVIGDGVGGARVTIRDVAGGKTLASGIQHGGTGDTKIIMQEPRQRGAVVYGTEGAAAFRATVYLERPTNVEISAEGPLKYPQAMQRVSTTMLLIPGRHIEGEGVLLEIHGFIVDITKAESAGNSVDIRTKVTMACGCPTQPGGLWNSDQIVLTARALRKGKVVAEAPLRYAGETSTYEGSIDAPGAGTYQIEVLASDELTVNFGRAARTVTVK
jgi:hypothetical protein